MSRLIIFEGPDGAGKSSAAVKVAKDLGADYVHLGPFPQVSKGLGRLYVEAIMPAVLGHRHLVMDRCWLSEEPYGAVFRNGNNRIGTVTQRLLERLALRCQTSLVVALPPKEEVLKNFSRRKSQEYLELPEQLSQVYDWYAAGPISARPTQIYDYTNIRYDDINLDLSSWAHPADFASAGNWSAQVLLVGEDFAKHTTEDPLYQWPFGSLSGGGCSRWLARQLQEGGISESQLCWINQDQLSERYLDWLSTFRYVVALGTVANNRLKQLKMSHDHHHYHHPQAWKRFKATEPYPLIDFLKETCR